MKDDGSPKRILMIAPTPFFADRGCHVRILGEAQSVIHLGHELVLCTYGLGRNVDGIPTVRTRSFPWYQKLSPGPSIHKLYVDLLLLWTVLSTCLRFRPEIIHAHLHEGVVIGKIASLLFRVPLVADMQGSLVAELMDHKFLPSWRWLLGSMYKIEKWIDHLPDYLIFSSTHTAENGIDSFQLDRARVATLMDGVDLEIPIDESKVSGLRKSLGIQPDNKVVVFVGVLTPYQGIDLLIEAIPSVSKQVPEVKFLILGYPNEDVYRARAKELGVEKWVQFTGKVNYDEVPTYLSLGDVAISPKKSASEANLKLFTYMALGLPTVVFDNRVNREILGDLGVYASHGDVEDLARSLVGILRDPERRESLGAQGRNKAIRDYSWHAVATRILDLYDSLMNDEGEQNEDDIGYGWRWLYWFTLDR